MHRLSVLGVLPGKPRRVGLARIQLEREGRP
jgi:hypothetical protein